MNTTRLTLARVLFTCALLATVPFALHAQDFSYDPQGAQAPDPPSRVARLSAMQGNVSFQPATVNDFSAAELNYPLTSGDRLYTDKGALAEIEIGNLTARLGQQADFTVTTLTDQVAQFGLAQGSVILRSYQLDPDTTTEIDTPNASVTVLASGVVRVDYYPDQNVTVVREISGQIQVDADGVHQFLEGPTQVLRVTGSAPSTWNSENLPRPDDLDRFSGQRDAYDRQASVSEESYVPPDMIGAGDLASNGDWESTGDYGNVWYPNNVADDWAPYSVGRWVSIAPWGWTWVGGERWGFAPYHYGRWVHVGRRWGWVPGPPTAHPMYSPALVAFVGGGGFSIGGGRVTAWFPLGPGEQYRPWYRTSPSYVNRVNAGGFHNNPFNNAPGGYMNRSAATAIPVRNFGNGRPVRESAVHVDPNQFRNAPVENRPPVAPPQRQAAVGPPARALPPLTARPVLPTRTGQNPNFNNPNANRNGNPNGYPNGQRNNTPPSGIVRPGNDPQRPSPIPGQPGRNMNDRQPQPGTSTQPGRSPYDRQPQPGTSPQPGNTPQPANPAQPPRDTYERPQRQLSPTVISPTPQTPPVERPNSNPQRQDQPQRQQPQTQTQPQRQDQQRPDFQRQQPQTQTQPQRPEFQRPEPQRTETRPVEPQRQPTPQPQAAPPPRIAPPPPPPAQPRPQAAPALPRPQPQAVHPDDRKKQ